ncbi:hypothetical protein Ahy_B08g092277 [Arachis hypogaea]|uniref:Uncharacterized protein n=1 Tax=Arachis hypogaea TaxID=3818 RepID=A0A444Y3P4_ARAHY|nr:hypothetical protein Ahy_B08g092277 [Arachis hypogaea]
MESVEPPHPSQEEPPLYHEPFLPSNEPSYPPQSPMNETLGVLLQGQEEMEKNVLNFVAALGELINQLASQHLNTQSTPMATCGESKEERSMKETLETPVDNEECGFVLEQVEEAITVTEKEVIEIDVKKASAQPPWHIPYEDLDGVDQEVSSLSDEDHASNPPSEKSTSANELLEYEDSFLIKSENDVEAEILRKGRTGVEYALSRTLETSPPRLSSTPSFEWIRLVSIRLTILSEYGILETDGQLRRLCGIRHKRRMFSSWSCKSMLIKVDTSRDRWKGSTGDNLVRSKRRVWYSVENSEYLPPGWNHDDQLEDVFRIKIWDPGIHGDPLWELKACEELPQGLENSLENDDDYWKNGNYNENRHQGWKNQRWEEPQGFDQPSWQQPPPMRYNQQPFCDVYQDNSFGGPFPDNQPPPNYYGQEPFQGAYQDNEYGGPLCSYQQAPPYAYDLPPQHSPYYQTTSYDPNPYPPYQPPYEPYEPYIDPPQFQPNYSQEPPPPYIPCPYPSTQEHYDSTYDSQAGQESTDRLQEAIDQLHAIIRQKFGPRDSCIEQSIPTDECVEQQVEKMETVEPPHPYQEEPPPYHEPFLPSSEPPYPPQSPMNETLGVLLQGQEEMEKNVLNFVAALGELINQLASQHLNTQSTPMATCRESKEERCMKETLETPVDNEERGFVLEQVEEAITVTEEEVYSSNKIEIDVKKASAQPPWHIPYEDLDRVDQEVSSLSDEDHASNPPCEKSTSANELLEYEDSFLIESENDVEAEIVRKGRTGVEYALSRTLETSPPRLSSTPSFEWIRLVSIRLTISPEYGILETDGQLRRLCGIKRKRRMFSGWSCKSRLIKVDTSRDRYKGSTGDNLVRSKRRVWYSIENLEYWTPGWNHDDQLEDGCKIKIWDLGIHGDPLWELKVCEELPQGLANSLENDDDY